MISGARLVESSSEKCYGVDLVDMVSLNPAVEHARKSHPNGYLWLLVGADFIRNGRMRSQRIPQTPQTGRDIEI